MGWTPIYLKMDDTKVLIVGAGEVGERRARRFLQAGGNVKIIVENVSAHLKDLSIYLKPRNEISKWVEWADIVVIATDDYDLNEQVAEIAQEKLLNRADCPDKGNIIIPSSFFIGDVHISIFTRGKSPLMAKELRKKIQRVITNEDIQQIEIQNFTRNILKEKIDDQKKRRHYLYEFLHDQKIQKFLKEGDIEDAKRYVKTSIENM
jgi:precorrin-2 dehydrogenase